MKLYYKPGACSLASHIVLTEIGTPFETEAVDTAAGRTESGADFRSINPRGYVPVLALDDGELVREGSAILQYLADKYPSSDLAPSNGTMARTRVQEYLSFVAADLHKSFSPLFKGDSTDTEKTKARSIVKTKFDQVENILADGREYLVDGKFSVADAYLFVVSNWANFTEIDLSGWPSLKAYVERVAARPATQTAMRAEGLIQ